MKSKSVVAYLVGQYLRTTHTFIHREVAELRRQGVEIHTYTVRGGTDFPDPNYLRDTPPTETVITFNPAKILRALLFCLRQSPKRFFGAAIVAWRLRSPGARGLVYAGFYFLEATLFAQSVARRGVTHLHNHFGDAAANVVVIASRLTGLPFSITFHGPDVFEQAARWHLGMKQKFAKFTIGTSTYASSQLRLHTDEADWDKLHLVRTGLPLAEYADPSPFAAPARWKLLFIARLVPAKGWKVLLEVAQRLKQANFPFSLSVVATGSPRRLQKLKATLLARGLEREVNVISACPPSAIQTLMQNHDVLVSTSFAEGLPLVLIEAMASGRPVVATAVGGVSDLVREGETGRLVAPGRADLIAEAIRELAADPDRAARLAAAGRDEVLAGYRAEVEYGKLKELFDA